MRFVGKYQDIRRLGRLLFNDRRRQIGIDSKTDRRKRRAEIADQIVIAPAGQEPALPMPSK